MIRSNRNWALSILLIIIIATSACTTTQTQVTTQEAPTEAVAPVAETTVEPAPTQLEIDPTNTPEPTAVPSQPFVIGMAYDTGPGDPHDSKYSFPNFIPLSLVYEPLVRYAPDGTIVPGLAETWELSTDGLSYTFHLRHDVAFHDGTPFNAEAAKWNFERWLGVTSHAWLQVTNLITGVDTPDDYTLVVTMSQPYYGTFQELSLVRPVRFLSPSSVNENGEFVKAVGTGPWMFDEWVQDQRSVFKRYDNYWGEKPKLEEVILEVVPDAQTRIAAVLSGDIQMTGGTKMGAIPAESIPLLKTIEDVQLETQPGTINYYLYTDFKNFPFDDVKVRQAINYAIDRKSISEKLYQGLGKPAYGLLPESIPYVHNNPDYYAYDPDKARALLAEAGWTAGDDGILEKDGKRFEVTFTLENETFPASQTIVQVIQAELKEIGIAMKINLVDYGTWSATMKKRDFQMTARNTWGAPYDPQNTLYGLFISALGGSAVVANVYSDPELDQMIIDVLATVNETDRQTLFDKIWKHMDENAAAIPVITQARVYLLGKNVQGFEFTGTEYEIDLTHISLEPGE